MNRKIIAFVLLFTLVLTCTTASAKTKKRKSSSSAKSAASSQTYSVLPKKGDISVLVEGENEQHVRIAETKIINSLIQHGYRVVDEAKMRKAKAAAVRAQAYRLAMQGNYNAIFKLHAGYSVAGVVIARVEAGQAWQNRIGYTGTASVAIMAVLPNGTKLGGRTSSSKQIGGSEYETLMKCVEAAVDDGMKQMYQPY